MRRRMFLLALALVLLMAGDSYSQKRSRQQPPNVPTQSPPVEQRGPEQIPPPTRTVPDEQSKEQSEKAERDRQEKAAIDKKIADETERLANQTAALSAHAERLTWFTLLLFFAALIQIGLFWWQLRMIKRTLAPAEEAAKAAQESANVAKASLDNLPLVERAYISGGGGYDTGRKRFLLQINNYGRTEGEILHIQIGFCELRSIPATPGFADDIMFRDILPPDLRSRTIRLIPVPDHLRHPVIFGRFHYRDIFKRRRSSGFILSIDRDTGDTQPIAAPDIYTNETED